MEQLTLTGPVFDPAFKGFQGLPSARVYWQSIAKDPKTAEEATNSTTAEARKDSTTAQVTDLTKDHENKFFLFELECELIYLSCPTSCWRTPSLR